jgi:tetratricopeptide (TPR) repeat protein
MTTKPMLASLLFATFLLAPRWSCAESAEQWFAKGEALLANGEFSAALRAFASAARADHNNKEYVQHYTMLRTIVDLRSRLETTENPQQWEQIARSLHAFYVNEKLYSELLAVDKQMHAKLNTAESAAMLAETQLAMDLNKEAAGTLSGLAPHKASASCLALLGIALVRTGKTAEAGELAGKLSLPDNATPGTKYVAARLYAAVGDSANALRLLGRCFESVLPSQLDGFKSHAKQCPEFAAMISTPEFGRVMETKSKMPESQCSGGGNCANCPMRGKCPASRGQ